MIETIVAHGLYTNRLDQYTGVNQATHTITASSPDDRTVIPCPIFHPTHPQEHP
jgi:hypothetical protein